MPKSLDTLLKMVNTDAVSREAAEQGASVTCKSCLQKEHRTRSDLISNSRIHCGLVLLIVLVVTVLTALSTYFAVKGSSGEELPAALPLPCAACPEGWIGFGSKCFYFSNDTRNWTSSQHFCASEGANLVHIDSQKELDFLTRYKGPFGHWIGLSRESSNDPWTWTDNAGHNLWFNVRGDGEFAYLNENGLSSGRVYTDRKWICSKPNNYADCAKFD